MHTKTAIATGSKDRAGGRRVDGGAWVVVVVVGRGNAGGRRGKERHRTPGSPFLIAPLASVYLIRHDQENRGRERQRVQGREGEREHARVPRTDFDGQTGSHFSSIPPESPASRQIFGAMLNTLIWTSIHIERFFVLDCFIGILFFFVVAFIWTRRPHK